MENLDPVAVVIALLATHGLLLVFWLYQRKWRIRYEHLYNVACQGVENARKEPILVWCKLHGQFTDYAATVHVHRDGRVTAPEKPELRILARLDSMLMQSKVTLGAPQWTAMATPLECNVHGCTAVLVLDRELYYLPETELVGKPKKARR